MGTRYHTLSRFAYAYDTAGAGTSSGGVTGFRDNRVAASKQYGSDAAQAQTTSYGYTDTSMLRGEGAALVSADLPAVNKSYGFDAMGNRTQTTDAVAKTQTNALYNRLNQVTGTSSYNTTSGAPVLSGTTSYGYDGDGNMIGNAVKDASGTQVGQSIYSYDEASRLVGIETPGQSKWQFTYDGLSRLRVSQVWSWQGGNWVPQPQQEIRRVYNGMDVVQERDVNNVVTASYTRTGNIGGILARTTASSSTFYGYDLGGNVTTLTDNSGAQVGSYTYDAWGNTVASSGVRAGENPYRFSTKESLAGFYSYGLRFYAPGLGRWINRDPIRESGGSNVYAFVSNNPINAVDLYGLDWLDNASNFSAGAGDMISFGATRLVRRGMGTDDVVNTNSGAYLGGAITGSAVIIAIAPESAFGPGAEAVAARVVIRQAVVTVGKRALIGAGAGALNNVVGETGTQISSYASGDGVDFSAIRRTAVSGAISGGATGAVTGGAGPIANAISSAYVQKFTNSFIKDQLKRSENVSSLSSNGLPFCKNRQVRP